MHHIAEHGGAHLKIQFIFECIKTYRLKNDFTLDALDAVRSVAMRLNVLGL